MPFVLGIIEHGTCPLPTAASIIVSNERRGKCSVNIYSVLVLVSYADEALPRQTVRRILNSIYWGRGRFDQQSSVNGACQLVKATRRHLWSAPCQALACQGKPTRLEKSQLCGGREQWMSRRLPLQSRCETETTEK